MVSAEISRSLTSAKQYLEPAYHYSASSASNSPSSEESIPPHTSTFTMYKSHQIAQVPQSPQNQANPNNAPTTTKGANNITNAKRKPKRRAERRATHNAVERQRRETLNGKFLDLVALLPNLEQVRGPSKSSIVNSSIAHVHASHHHRLIASRELGLLELESDALRREVNEWRNRAGISVLEEPVRSEAFSMATSGELEVITGVQAEEEDDDMAYGYGGFNKEDDSYRVVPQVPAICNAVMNSLVDPWAENFPHGGPAQQDHYNSDPVIPMLASPSAVSFENHISTTPESNINDEPEDNQNYPSLIDRRRRRNDGYRRTRQLRVSHSHTPYTRPRPENKDIHVAFPSTKSAISSVSSPSQSNSDSRLGVNITTSLPRMNTDSVSEPSLSPASYGSFDNFSNMSYVTSNSVQSFVDYPCSNYPSCNGGTSSPNARANTSHNWSNWNGLAKTFSNWSNGPSPMAANENRSRPGSAQSGSSGGRSDSP